MEVVILVILTFVYLIPSCIALARGHQSAAAILVTNILFGWSGIGWVVALIWSLTGVNKPHQVVVNNITN